METPGGNSFDQPSPIPAAEPTPMGVHSNNNSGVAAANQHNNSNNENQLPPRSGSSQHHHQQQHQQPRHNSSVSIASHSDPAVDSLAGQLTAESAKIQVELERLKMRRRMIEEQRRALCAASPNTISNNHQQNNQQRSTSSQLNCGGGGGTSSVGHAQHHQQRSASTASDLTNIVTHPGDLPPGGTARKPIEGEAQRKRRCEHSAHYQMKEAIRDMLEHDSTIVGGTFVPNPHTSRQGTFSRAVRFAIPIGQQSYYLSYDQQQLQGPNFRRDRRVLTASSRGRAGTNVNSHWNDAKGGVAPGPGAYTPRTWFLSTSSSKQK